jgi:hypothetical protein
MTKALTPIPAYIGWLLALAALALPASAEEANQKGKGALVRAIDLQGFRRDKTSGVATRPTKITSAEELAKAFPDTDRNWRDQIARQVDFEKEELLFFAWTGSNTDSLSFKVEQTGNGPIVVFRYKKGFGEDVPRPRFRLYSIAKNNGLHLSGRPGLAGGVRLSLVVARSLAGYNPR